MDFTVGRTFSSLYIVLDIAWLLSYGAILLAFKKWTAVVVGLVMGVVYFFVDYGYFYQLAGTRHVEGADPFWFLLWLSMSYGFTNFAWIWLLLDRDGHAVEWSVLPILGWLAVGQLSNNFGDGFAQIHIWRGVGAYHGVMAAILLVGYVIIVLRNLRGTESVSSRSLRSEPSGQVQPGKERAGVNILWLLAIGIGVQFAWEASLLLNGIRPALWQPIVVNSLIETNLGLPYIYLIHRAVTAGRARREIPKRALS